MNIHHQAKGSTERPSSTYVAGESKEKSVMRRQIARNLLLMFLQLVVSQFVIVWDTVLQ